MDEILFVVAACAGLMMIIFVIRWRVAVRDRERRRFVREESPFLGEL